MSDVIARVSLALCEALFSGREERGQTLAEYGLIMSIISIAVMVAAVFAFRDVLPGAFEAAAECLDGAC